MSAVNAADGWSLRRRLAQVLVSTALLPVLLFSVALLWSQWQRDRQDLLLRLDANARLSADSAEMFLDAQMAGVRLLVDRIVVSPEESGQAMESLLNAYPAVVRALRLDAEGQALVIRDARGRRLPLSSGNAAGSHWFNDVRDQLRPLMSVAYVRPALGREEVVALVAPMMRDGGFAGALQAEIPVASFARLDSASLAQRKMLLMYLDQSGQVAYAHPALRWKVFDKPDGVLERIRRQAHSAERAVQVQDIGALMRDGGAGFVGAVAMRNGWTLVLVTPKSALWAPLLPRLLLLLGLILVTFAGLALALWQQRVLLKNSIGYLLASLRGYALGGRISPTASDDMPDELKPLAAGVAELGERMNAAYAELQQVLDGREQVIAERTASLRRAVADLDRISRTDALTGCLNYRGFSEAGEQLWRQAQEGSEPLSVLALDIDHFKLYNDLYGHAEGDGVLRRFAGAVRSALLHSDDVLARPGGEEFTVFLPNTTSEQALHVASRVVQRVRDADIAHAGSSKGHLTVSVGVATREVGDVDVEEVLKRADAALYRAKAAGRDGFSG